MSKNANDVVITTYARTAIDKMGGAMTPMHSSEITAQVLTELLKRSGLKHEQIDEIIHGTASALEVGIRTNIPVRQALLIAGFPVTTLSNNIDRACCSGTTVIEYCRRFLEAGYIEVAMATGADNMSNLPLYLDAKYRWGGSRLGNVSITDALVGAGYKGYGIVAKDAGEVAVAHGIGREMQDEWAALSHEKWGKAYDRGFFNDEIFPLEIPQGKNKAPLIFDKDQMPRPGTSAEQLAKLPTVYGSPTVTAGNCPGINSGATGMIITTRAKAEKLGLTPLAKVLKTASIADNYNNIATVPGQAIKLGLEMNGLKLDDLGLIEINEAFAAVCLTATKVLSGGDDGLWKEIRDKTNVNGGSIAIGHPLGATGIRLVMTMIPELKARGLKYGAAAICGGLAQGDACFIEIE